MSETVKGAGTQDIEDAYGVFSLLSDAEARLSEALDDVVRAYTLADGNAMLDRIGTARRVSKLAWAVQSARAEASGIGQATCSQVVYADGGLQSILGRVAKEDE